VNDTRIRVGIGGWTYPPWRGTFYPAGLPHREELAWASRQLGAIEVNGTFYSRFQPAHFAAWRDATPEGFVFALKAHRFTTHRRQLATAGEGIANFIASGIAELGPRLGPIVWQLMPTTRFEPDDLAAFLGLLPRAVDGLPLDHVLDARHASFDCPEYRALLQAHACTTVYTDAPDHAAIAHPGSDLAYLRLMRARAGCPTGYPEAELAQWAAGAQAWTAPGGARRAYVFFINGAKERAPAAAQALQRRLNASA